MDQSPAPPRHELDLLTEAQLSALLKISRRQLYKWRMQGLIPCQNSNSLIDEIVRLVRFPGWQQTAAGEGEVQKALRKSLLKYKLHTDQDLFDRAYGYVVQYY